MPQYSIWWTAGDTVDRMVSDRGGKYGFVYKSRQDVYRKLVAKGMSQEKAARIANKGKSKAGRSAMAKKAARTRSRKR